MSDPVAQGARRVQQQVAGHASAAARAVHTLAGLVEVLARRVADLEQQLAADDVLGVRERM